MSDTQWPRFMVFQKMAADQPWQHNGTVHAPDAELALLNARDVFMRRPDAVGLFVVPDSAIYRVTREQLETPEKLQDSRPFSQPKAIQVFAKPHEQSACEFLGTLEATSALQALEAARGKWGASNPLWWWLFPTEAVTGNAEEEAESMFAPARDKTYKNSSEYHTVTMMRQLHAKGRLEEGQ